MAVYFRRADKNRRLDSRSDPSSIYGRQPMRPSAFDMNPHNFAQVDKEKETTQNATAFGMMKLRYNS
jgi:hypothetical protein